MAFLRPMKMLLLFIQMFVTTVVYTPKPLLASCPLLEPPVTSFLQESLTGQWYNAKRQAIAAFVCCKDTSSLLRDLQMRTSSAVHIPPPPHWHKSLSKIAAAGRKERLTYIVDLTCHGIEELLYQAGKYRLLKIPNRWLLLNVTGPANLTDNAMAEISTGDLKESAQCSDTAGFLAQRGPGFGEATATDSEVTLVCGLAGSGLVLVDMWAATPLGYWLPGSGFKGDQRPPAVRRLDVGLNGYELKVALMLMKNSSLEHMDDGMEKKHDILSKFNWEVTNTVAKMLNASVSLRFGTSYGYLINGSWTGIIGMQIRGEVEMTGTSIAVVTSRVSIIRYTNFPLPAFGVFIFRAPPMSYEHNIFTQPFPAPLWLASIGIVVLCAIMLYAVLRVEMILEIEVDHSKLIAPGIDMHIIAEGRKRRLEAAWSDVALLVFGAVCQQGSPTEARGVTGRIITLSLFVGILFLYVSYSASIIALLQSTSSSIKTNKDLLASKIAIGAEANDYNIQYVKHFQDPVRKKIVEKKLKNNFMSVEEGIRRMRTSYFAFHTMRSLMYGEISDTFQEHEKCGLQEVRNFVTLQDPMTTIANWSQNTELIMLAMRKLHERGIRNRQIRRFLAPKPQCVNKGANFQSVALIDCEAAFVVLGIGYGISVLFIFMEKLVFRHNKALCNLRRRGIGLTSKDT